MQSTRSASFSRRDFIGRGAAMFVAGSASGWTPAAKACALGVPFGLQMYTLHAEMKQDFAGTLRAAAEIGYRQVELPGYYGRDARQVQAALSAAGLKCASGMFAMKSLAGEPNLMDHPQQCIEFGQTLGLEYIVCPALHAPQGIAALTLDDYQRNAELFNRLGEQMRAAGIRFGYHNHNFEFREYDGVTGLDMLLRRTEPDLVTMELDCGWAAAAGLDPASYLAQYPGRFSLLHLKDLKAATPTTEMKMTSVEVGSGVIDWKKVLTAARAAGVKAGFVEQEPPFVRPALESARRSFEYLTALR